MLQMEDTEVLWRLYERKTAYTKEYNEVRNLTRTVSQVFNPVRKIINTDKALLLKGLKLTVEERYDAALEALKDWNNWDFLKTRIALFVLMFTSWYGSEISGQVGEIEGAGAGGSAWQALELIPLVLMLTVAVTVGAALLRLLGSGWRPTIAPGAAIAVLGGLSALLIGFRILVPPDLGQLGGIEVEATPGLGVFLALLAAAGVAYGGYRAMGEEGSSFEAVADSLQPRHARPASRKRRSSSSG